MVYSKKQIFAEALFQLCEKKQIKNISIQEICDLCEVNRQTFYYYFTSKYDLISWIYEQHVNQIYENIEDLESLKKQIYYLYDWFIKHKSFYSKVVKINGQESLDKFLYKHTYNYYINYISKKYGKEKLTGDLLFSISYHCYGCVHICIDWISNGMNDSADIIASRIFNNTPRQLLELFA